MAGSVSVWSRRIADFRPAAIKRRHYWGAGLVVLALLVVGLYFAFRSTDKPPPAVVQERAVAPAESQRVEVPAGPVPAEIDLATVAKVKEATVYLRVQLPNGGVAEGSGFLCLEPGIVMTNAHVLGMLWAEAAPPAKVEVVVHSGEANQTTLAGSVLGVDRSNDLAILRVPADAPPLPPPLPVDSAAKLSLTQKLYVFGFPLGAQLGRNITVNPSSVSSLRKNDAGVLSQVQVHGGMEPGNSGGPVTDARGVVVGVSVAIIRGTQINFAIPGDFVRQALDGKFAGRELGKLYRDNGTATLPVKLTCLDPLKRVRDVKVEVWAGDPGDARPAAWQAPPALPSDGPPQSYPVSPRDGAYTVDVPLPPLPPGKVYWLRPVMVNAAGATQWDTATPLALAALPILDRKPALLQFKAPTAAIDRTLKLQSKDTMSVYRGNASAALWTEKMEGDVLESLKPDPRGTGTFIRLTLGKCPFTREEARQTLVPPPQAQAILSLYSPTFLVDASHACKERGKRDFQILNPQFRDAVESMYETVCNTYEATTLSVPNRMVQPLESWPAHMPLFVLLEGKRQIRELHLTCTYEGMQSAPGRNEAFLGLSGEVKGRGDRAALVLGKVKGHALFDVDKGFLTLVHVTVNSEVEVEDKRVRVLVIDENVLTRSEGNSLGIAPARADQPGPRKR